MRTKIITTITLVFTTIMAIAMILQQAGSLIQQVRGVTEDDGYITGDDDSQGEVSSQEELENTYEDTPWENNVGPNDFEDAQDRDNDAKDNNDDNSNTDDSNEDLPICQYKVVQDCVINELGQTCLQGTTEDACQDIFYGYDGNLKPGEKTFNNDNSKDLPVCEYKVVRDCVVNELGQTCLIGTTEDVCQDVFYGYDGNLKPGEKTFSKHNNNNNNDSPRTTPSKSTVAPAAPTAPITDSNVLVNATAEEEAAENACSAIGNGDAKKYTPLIFTKKMWADACPWLSAYNQAYVGTIQYMIMVQLGSFVH